MPRTPRKPARADLAERPDVSVYLDKARQLWRAEIRLRQDPHTGRCQVKKVSSKSKHTLYDKLAQVLEALDEGVNSPARYTVADCVAEFLRDQTADLAPTTRDNYTRLARTHITLYLGRYLLAELRVADVLARLRGRKPHLSSRTLRLMLNLLERAIRYAQVEEMLARNVAELARLDQRGKLKGDKPGRPSKSMTLEQAVAVLKAAEGTRWYAYLVLSIVTGARTEEIRALAWEQIDTNSGVPTIHVWTSVRGDGDTKTRRSRRSLELPRITVKAITAHKAMQARERLAAAELWQDNDLVSHSTLTQRVLHRARDTAGPPQRPAGPAHHREKGRTQRQGMDSARTAPHLCVAAVGPRREHQGDLAPDRPRRHRHHRTRLPPPTEAGTSIRSAGDGRHPARRGLTPHPTPVPPHFCPT